MPSTYSTSLRLELIADGEQSGTWGDTTNNNLGALLEQAICGNSNIVMPDANYTLTVSNGVVDESRSLNLTVTGSITATRTITVPLVPKLYIVFNGTTNGFPIIIKGATGAGVLLVNGDTMMVYCNGTGVFPVAPSVNTELLTPSWGVYAATQQSISAGILTSVTFGTVGYDVGGNIGTGSVAVPHTAGNYLITTTVGIYSGVMQNTFLGIHKNGNINPYGVIEIANNYLVQEVVKIIPMNGTTDYLEIKFLNANGCVLNGNSVSAYVNFAGSLMG